MLAPRMHLATLVGRWRTDWGLLVLMAAVVAVTTALMASVAPLGERTADRASCTVSASAPRRLRRSP